MIRKSSESAVVETKPEKGWRISATIKDKGFELMIKHRLVDDEISQEQLVIEGIHLYLAQRPKRLASSKADDLQTARNDALSAGRPRHGS